MPVIGTSHWLLGLPRQTYGTTGSTWLLGLPRQEIFPTAAPPSGSPRYGSRRKKDTMELIQSTAANFPIFMFDSADHVSGKTGLTLTIAISKNGGASAAITPTVTEIGNGRYNLALTTAHTDTLGPINGIVTAAGADPQPFEALVVLAKALDSTVSKPGTAQTISSNADIAAIKVKTDNLPASPAAVSNIPTVAQIADGVWDEAISGHLTGGSTGAALNGAGAAGDPWTATLPGAYGAGTAGKIVGDNINAPIAAVKAKTDNIPASPAAVSDIPSAATNAAAVRTNLTTELGRIDVAISTRSAPGTAQTITAPADMALNSTVAKEATLTNRPTLVQIEASTVLAQVADIPTVGQIADGVWDEVLTGATHNVQNSAGKRLRTIAQMVVSSDVAQGPGTGPNQIILAAAEPSVDGTFDPSLIAIVGGTGVGQCRRVLEYVGSTRAATVNRNWKTAPDATSEYVIYADAGGQSSNEGKVRAASSNTVQLNTLAASTDDAYIGQTVWIVSGTGDDQAKMITDYNGTTKTATIDGTWAVTPDTTSAYILLPTAAVMLGDGQAADLAEIKAKTDNLPSDPADQSAVEAAIAAIPAAPTAAQIAIEILDNNTAP